jgi:cytochrome c oxidase cbb3-type subunit 3
MSNEKHSNYSVNEDSQYEIDTLTNERLLKDHSYDGIQELDNDLPPWWKWLFYITIVFGVIYLIRLWVFEADDLVQNTEFKLEMASVANLAPAQQQNTAFEIKVLTDAASIAAGKDIYDKSCSVCHTADGGGLVGPNFTDDYWIHGNTMEEMYQIVTDGVLEKGMTPFKDQLSPQKRLEVLSYIITMHGTTPANPKAAEGDKLDWPY